VHDAPTPSERDTSVRVLILDLDGTVLSSRGCLERRTVEAIRRVSARGIQIVFASARPLWSIRELTSAVRPAHYVAAGGAVVADPDGAVLARWPLAGGELRRVIDLLDETDVPALLYRDELTMRHGDSSAIRAEALLTAREQHLPRWDGGPVDKLLAIADGAEQLVRELERVPVAATTSHASYVEVTAAGVDKARASEVVLRWFRADWRDVMAIGDGDNDVCVLREAGYALTVAGGSRAAREVADRIVGTNDDGSVARVIDRLGARRSPATDVPDLAGQPRHQRLALGDAPTPQEGQR
jgi:Cof subfamily protein (haloacid dehalogenase superfamily)